MLYSVQIRAARAALNLSALELAEIADVNAGTVRNLENSDDAIEKAEMKTIKKIKSTLEERGIKFLSPSEVDGILTGAGIRYFPKR
jgi:transcriptional regulator with XRE-family HTH domain